MKERLSRYLTLFTAAIGFAVLTSSCFFSEDTDKTALPAEKFSASEKQALADIEARGVLKIAFSPDARPFTFTDSSGKPAGAVKEILENAAREMNLKPEFIAMDQDSMLFELRRSGVDIACGQFSSSFLSRLNLDSLSVNIATSTRLLMSEEFYSAHERLSLMDDKSIEFLFILSDPVTPENLRTELPHAALRGVKTAEDALRMLAEKKNAVFALSHAEALKHDMFSDKTGFILFPSSIGSDTVSVALKHNNGALKEKLSTAFQELLKSGKTSAICSSYFPGISCNEVKISTGEAAPAQ